MQRRCFWPFAEEMFLALLKGLWVALLSGTLCTTVTTVLQTLMTWKTRSVPPSPLHEGPAWLSVWVS